MTVVLIFGVYRHVGGVLGDFSGDVPFLEGLVQLFVVLGIEAVELVGDEVVEALLLLVELLDLVLDVY